MGRGWEVWIPIQGRAGCGIQCWDKITIHIYLIALGIVNLLDLRF